MKGKPGARARILIADDEPQIRRFVRIALQANGYEVLEASSGQEAIKFCANDTPSLVILDLGLPDIDGKEVLVRIRKWSNIPILIVSIRSKETEKIEALELGADDYIIKPFNMPELMERVNAALAHNQSASQDKQELVAGKFRINQETKQVVFQDKPLPLTSKEYEMLSLLAQHDGLIVTDEQLLRELWGEEFVKQSNLLRQAIRSLRQKIEPDPNQPRYIITESGIGYRLYAQGQ